MLARIAVGLSMMAVFPVGFIGGAFIGEGGNKELGGIMVGIGLLLGLPFAYVGYRVIRGGMSLSALPGFLLVLAVFFVWVWIQANGAAQSPR